jgi:predicted CxxxxCH...CXXCH cytochrome family protein
MANPINANAGASYGKGTSWTQTNTPSALQACSNTYCHSSGTSVATGTIPANTSPNWGGSGECNSCHGTGGPVTGAPNYANLKKQPTAAVGVNWTTPTNVYTSDNAYAVFNNITQSYLYATGFGYSLTDVPDSATITGIAVVIEGNGTSATAAERQIRVAVTKTGAAVVGTPKTGVQLNQTTDTEIVIGGIADLWGTTLTPAEVRAATFGVAISDNTPTANALNIDTVKIVVFTNTAPKMNSHSEHSSKTCDICHNAVTTDGTTIADTTLHNNGAYNLLAKAPATFTYNFVAATGGTCSTVSCHGNANWGASDFDCVSCHSVTQGITVGPNAGGTRDAVSLEFANAWSHKRSAGGVVTKYDCCVCHLEGDSATGSRSVKHADGYIDLRDPDGSTTEAAIKNIAGTADYRFGKFSTSYAAGSRTSTGHTAENTDNIITQNFCLHCHDSNGATNTGAQVSGGTQYKPFNTTIAGAGYVTPLSAGVAGGVVDVKTQLSTLNRSWHPVLGPKNRDFPTAVRMNDPYKATGTRGTSGTLSQGVVLNCFDCHNVSGASPLTTRTVAAHGNAETIRGIATVSGTPSAANSVTLCQVCHAGYTVSPHGTGSAWVTGNNGGMTVYAQYGCNICHSSGFTTVVPRPIRAQDTHGSNTLGTVGTLLTTTGRWLTDPTPVAFIRNRQVLPRHAPLAMAAQGSNPAWAGGTQCMGGNVAPCSQGTQTYTVGGTY